MFCFTARTPWIHFLFSNFFLLFSLETTPVKHYPAALHQNCSCWGHQRTLTLWNPVIRSVLITAGVDLSLLWKHTFFTWFKDNLSFWVLSHFTGSSWVSFACYFSSSQPSMWKTVGSGLGTLLPIRNFLASSVLLIVLNAPAGSCLSSYTQPSSQHQLCRSIHQAHFALEPLHLLWLFPRMLSFWVFISHSLTSHRCLPLCHLLKETFQDLTFSRCAFPALLFSHVLITTTLTLYYTCLFALCLYLPSGQIFFTIWCLSMTLAPGIVPGI